jgi:hypothetical protein
LLALAVTATGAAAALTYLAVRPGDDPAAAVLDVADVVTLSPPPTVPPLATVPPATAPAPDPRSDRSADDPTAASTVPLSPLAALVGERGTAIPPPVEPRVRPVGLRIGEIFVDDPVVTVGLEDDGELEVPGADEIGWYRYGAAPGHPGATVLAAHVTWNGDYGPFLNLGELAPGDVVEVALEDGGRRVYEVVERTMYDKDGLPRDRIWRNTGEETLVLITCGGDFNPDINRYRQNIVVYAVPVA